VEVGAELIEHSDGGETEIWPGTEVEQGRITATLVDDSSSRFSV
jgi:hypothetical protein